MKAKIARVVYEEIELEDVLDVITQAEAARELDMTVGALRLAMNAGRLPTIILEGKSRRYTLRSAVEGYTSHRRSPRDG